MFKCVNLIDSVVVVFACIIVSLLDFWYCDIPVDAGSGFPLISQQFQFFVAWIGQDAEIPPLRLCSSVDMIALRYSDSF